MWPVPETVTCTWASVDLYLRLWAEPETLICSWVCDLYLSFWWSVPEPLMICTWGYELYLRLWWSVPEVVLPSWPADDKCYPEVEEGQQQHRHQEEQDEGDLVHWKPLEMCQIVADFLNINILKSGDGWDIRNTRTSISNGSIKKNPNINSRVRMS